MVGFWCFSLHSVPVFVSSGHADVAEVMKDGGVTPERLIIDNRALDTVRELEPLS